MESIERARTKAKSPQANGICERRNKTRKDEFCSVAFWRRVYRSVEEIQVDLGEWLGQYNREDAFGQVLLRQDADETSWIQSRWPGRGFLATKNLTDGAREL